MWEVTTNFTKKFQSNSTVHKLLHVNSSITAKLMTAFLWVFVVNTRNNRKDEGTLAPWKSIRQNQCIKNFKLWYQSKWYPTFSWAKILTRLYCAWDPKRCSFTKRWHLSSDTSWALGEQWQRFVQIITAIALGTATRSTNATTPVSRNV
jgi:hypothetical protein